MNDTPPESSMLVARIGLRRSRIPSVSAAAQGHKTPLTKNGFKDATTDPDIIRKWWNKHPSANIGLRPPQGVVIIDVDPAHGGADTLAALIETLGPLPDNGPLAATGGGGWHYWLSVPSGVHLVGSTWSRCRRENP